MTADTTPRTTDDLLNITLPQSYYDTIIAANIDAYNAAIRAQNYEHAARIAASLHESFTADLTR